MSWQTRLLRLTVFPLGLDEINLEEVWTNTLEIDPDKKEYLTKDSKETISANLDDKTYIMERNPARIDFVIKVSEDVVVNETTVELGTLGEFNSIIENYSEKFISFLENIDRSYKRVAFGSLVHTKMESRSTGYNHVAQKISFLQDSINADTYKELHIKANKPGFISVIDFDELEINRLTTWTIAKLSGSLNAAGNELDLSESYYTQLELDINTDKDNKYPINQETSKEILNQLIENSQSILAEGI